MVCPGGTGTLVELSIVWEMINKGVMRKKPVVSLGSFWAPVIECVRGVELGHDSVWGERAGPLIHIEASPTGAAHYLQSAFAAPASTSG